MPGKKEDGVAKFLKSIEKEAQQFVLGELEKQETRVGEKLNGDAKLKYLRDAANRYIFKKRSAAESKKLMSKTRIKKKIFPLTCQLTDKEFMERARELAFNIQKTSRVESEKKKIMDDFKSKLSQLDTEHLTLSNIVRDGEEVRDVKVEVEYNWVDGKKYSRRMDTAKIYEKQNIEEHEKQRDFFED